MSIGVLNLIILIEICFSGSGTGVGRGVTTGRPRETSAVIRTRPSGLTDKKGSGGTPINVFTNYFSIKSITKENWVLRQYR